MWKFALGGLVALWIAYDLSSGARRGWMEAKAPAMTRENVQAILQASADKMNTRKGERHGQDDFLGARVEGLMLVHEYALGWVPHGFDRAAAKKAAAAQVTPRVCGRELRSTLAQGAAIKFVYRNQANKEFLFDVTIREADCRQA